MTEGCGPSPAFVRLVRNALTHLYDYAYLENHQLAGLIDTSGGLDRVTRAQRLRRMLLDCIEEVQPANTGAAVAEADRIHAILTYRYVDGLPMPEVATKRGLGERQAYRTLEAGVEAVAGLMYDHLREAKAPVHSVSAEQLDTSSPLQLAQAEVEHLREAAHSEPLDLREVLTVALRLIEPLCQQSSVRIDVVTPPPWPPVLAHRVMLRQALLNVLTHAVDCAVQGDLTVAVGEGLRDAVLTIAGQARAAAVQSLPPRGVESDQVGLTVVQALLAAQGGRLVTGVAEGCWSAQLYLPLATSPTLLVIDDNADLVALLQRYLAAHRVRVVGTSDAEQGLRLAGSLRPSVITLDVMMPEQDGWDVLQRLRQDPATSDIPVVICSILREARLATAMGASAYITKPVTQADLLEVLSRWLGPLQAAE